MFLEESDKKYLKEVGYIDKDMDQIERAVAVTDFEVDGKPMDLVSVLRIMDRKDFLSGMGRSAFHWSAMRTAADGREVYFDSSKLFK